MTDYKEILSRAKVGLFTHYTWGTYPGKDGGWETRTGGSTARSVSDPRPAASVEELAAALDAENYADAAEEMAAEYVIFTISHAGMNLLYPSDFMRTHGLGYKCAATDAAGKLADALKERGIPLLFYIALSDTHDLSENELRAMGYDLDRYQETRDRIAAEIVAEICRRYEGRFAGFWFDQCGCGQPAVDTVHELLPGGAVFINTGIVANENKPEAADFLVSETYRVLADAGKDKELIKDDVSETDHIGSHHSQVCPELAHGWWAIGEPRPVTITALGMFRYTVRCAATTGAFNGGIAWGTGQYIDQSFEPGVRQLMRDYGGLMRSRGEALFGTVPGRSYPTPPGDIDPAFVSTESADGKTVYIHILRPSDGGFILPAPADGRIFTKARMLDGTALPVEPKDGGYYLKYARFDGIDTVVALN